MTNLADFIKRHILLIHIFVVLLIVILAFVVIARGVDSSNRDANFDKSRAKMVAFCKLVKSEDATNSTQSILSNSKYQSYDLFAPYKSYDWQSERDFSIGHYKLLEEHLHTIGNKSLDPELELLVSALEANADVTSAIYTTQSKEYQAAQKVNTYMSQYRADHCPSI